MKLTKQQQKALLQIVADTLWMARRYADKRSSYAVQTFNDSVHLLDEVGLSELLTGDPAEGGKRFADDGMFGAYDPATKRYTKLS